MRNFFIWLLFLPSTANACDVIDDLGRQVHLNHPAQRVIVLAPDLTEILFAAGAGNKIVGVISGSDYPAAAKKVPIVGDYHSLNQEKILLLHPDLIVAWPQSHSTAVLSKLSVPIYYSDPKKLADIPSVLHRVGCLAGTQKTADQTALLFSAKLNYLKKHYSHKKTVSVFYQVWPQPLVTVGAQSWINDAIEICGGKNIFADLKSAAPEVSLEAVIAANPEVIIRSDGKEKSNWTRWTEITAVKKNNLFAIDPDLLERASPRIISGVDQLCRAIDKARITTQPRRRAK